MKKIRRFRWRDSCTRLAIPDTGVCITPRSPSLRYAHTPRVVPERRCLSFGGLFRLLITFGRDLR